MWPAFSRPTSKAREKRPGDEVGKSTVPSKEDKKIRFGGSLSATKCYLYKALPQETISYFYYQKCSVHVRTYAYAYMSWYLEKIYRCFLFYHLKGINISHYIDVFVLGFPLSFYWLSAGKWIREQFNPIQTEILFASYDRNRGPSEAASPRYNFKTAHDTAINITQNDLPIISNIYVHPDWHNNAIRRHYEVMWFNLLAEPKFPQFFLLKYP